FARSSSPGRSPAHLRTLAARRSRRRELRSESLSSVQRATLYDDSKQAFHSCSWRERLASLFMCPELTKPIRNAISSGLPEIHRALECLARLRRLAEMKWKASEASPQEGVVAKFL